MIGRLIVVVVWALVAGCDARSVCAGKSGKTIDPDLTAHLHEAMAYWYDRGVSGLYVVDGEECDVPVREGNIPSISKAWVSHPLYQSECEPVRIDLNRERWGEVERNTTAVRVLAHEIGHLYCYADSDVPGDVMSWDWHVDGL